MAVRRPLLCVFLFALMFFRTSDVHCQDFPKLHYTIENGLPSNIVYEIYRDSKGFLWFATNKGIARYNGIRFEIFTTFDGLPDNEIFFFQEDYYGRLWLSTFNGELCYYKDNVFHNATNTAFLKLPFRASFIKQIKPEKDSSVTIGFNEQAIFLNITKNDCKTFDLHNEYIDKKILYEVARISKLADTDYQLDSWDVILHVNNKAKITDVRNKPESERILYLPCQNQEYAYNKNLVTIGGKKIFNPFKNFTFNLYSLQRIYYDNRYLFYATNNGLIINDSLRILNEDNVSSVTQDNQGNYWVSTLNNGVFNLDNDFFKEKLMNGIYIGQIKYSAVKNNNLFFTTADNNLYHLEKDRASCLFNYGSYKSNHFQLAPDPCYLIDNSYKYYSFYNNDHIVIDNVLAKEPVIKRYANEFIANGIRYIFSADNNIYLQHRKRVTKIDYNALHIGDDVSEKSKDIVNESTNAYRIFGVAQAPDNSIWFSTINSVNRIVNGVNILQPWFKKIAFKSFNFFGQFLIGYTHNNQLLVCSNINNNNIRVDSIPPQNCIWDKLYPLDQTHILISTNNLYRLLTLYPDDKTNTFSISAIENQYIPLQAESIAADSSNCYFFKNGSITSIDIKTLLLKPEPPKLAFTFLKTIDKSYPVQNEIEISFSESRNITLGFSTLAFSGKDVSYQYSVSKFDQDNWSPINGEEINIINSGYGNQTIKIRAKSSSSNYSEPIVFNLIISRPYWATWWFILLCICATIAIIIFIIRYRIVSALRKKEKEHKREIKYMKSEYKALNALMNPHFIFNTLNNVQSLVNRNDKLAANEYLRVFADLIRQNMHNISKELIPLQKEIDLVSNYLRLEKLRFKDHLNYCINVDEGIDISEIMVPPLLVQPLVENSIKHGILPLESIEGFIHLDIYERNSCLYIQVKDNGVGISNAQKKQNTSHESFGLENIKKRIEQLSIIQNKEITFNILEIKDEEGKQWTEVTFCMPIS